MIGQINNACWNLHTEAFQLEAGAEIWGVYPLHFLTWGMAHNYPPTFLYKWKFVRRMYWNSLNYDKFKQHFAMEMLSLELHLTWGRSRLTFLSLSFVFHPFLCFPLITINYHSLSVVTRNMRKAISWAFPEPWESCQQTCFHRFPISVHNSGLQFCTRKNTINSRIKFNHVIILKRLIGLQETICLKPLLINYVIYIPVIWKVEIPAWR